MSLSGPILQPKKKKCFNTTRSVMSFSGPILQPEKKKCFYFIYIYIYIYILFKRLPLFGILIFFLCISILLFKGLLLFGFLIFQFKNAYTLLCLSKDKTKGQSGKNMTLTPIKTMPKNRTTLLLIFKLIYSLINRTTLLS